MAYSVRPLDVCLRRARAAHRRPDDGDPSRQAPRGLRHQPERRARGHRVDGPADRGACSRTSTSVPEEKRTAVRNNGGGHANHTLFWEIMGPTAAASRRASSGLRSTRHFGSFDELKAAGERRRSQALRRRAGAGSSGTGPDWPSYSTAEPGLAGHGVRRAAARNRRLGARLLPQLPEQATRLSRGVVERRQLGRRRREVRAPRGRSRQKSEGGVRA